MRRKLLILTALVALAVAAIGAIYISVRDGRQSSPVVVIGMDGIEWDILLPMIRRGRLPNFAALMDRGTYGKLETVVPTISPSIWTTIATGKVRERHGITGFVQFSREGGARLVTNANRTTKAIWNILTDHQRSVSTIGWWMTYPVEEINGVMVAQTNTRFRPEDFRTGKHLLQGTLRRGIEGQVHPPRRNDEMLAVLDEVDRAMPGLLRRIFGDLPHALDAIGERFWASCQWVVRADETYRRIALKLARERPLPDLQLIYFSGTDVISHFFWRYMKPELYQARPSPEQIENFGAFIERYYAHLDRTLGELVEAYGDEATIMVLSDHGMHAVNLDSRFEPEGHPKEVMSGGHTDGPPAVLIAAGPGIRRSPQTGPLSQLKKQELQTLCHVNDITPTLLAMLRIPVGQDMDGKVAEKMFTKEADITSQPPAVATHDTKEFFKKRGRLSGRHPHEDRRLKQLRSLGYIGGEQGK